MRIDYRVVEVARAALSLLQRDWCRDRDQISLRNKIVRVEGLDLPRSSMERDAERHTTAL